MLNTVYALAGIVIEKRGNRIMIYCALTRAQIAYAEPARIVLSNTLLDKVPASFVLKVSCMAVNTSASA